jgi:hypothetical protein
MPLVLLLPLVWRAGLALARAATADRELSRFLAPAVALAVWLLCIHAVGLASSSFYGGLVAGTVVTAAAGALMVRKGLGDGAEPSPPVSRWIWPGSAAAMAVLAGPELKFSKHDECLIVGHLSIPAEMLNGVYPPRHLTFPQFELRYHYGTDLLTAVTSALLGRIDVHTTVHALAILLWGYSFALYWLLGERWIGGRGSGAITATCVLFAGGAPYFCRSMDQTLDYFTSNCKAAGVWITPPFVSNFLQHPWSLGMPLFGAILLVLTRFERAPPWAWGWVVMTLLTVALALAQLVLFVCLVPSLCAVGPWEGRTLSRARLLRLAGWAAVTLIASRLLHGFLAPVAEPSAGHFGWHPFSVDATAWEWASWHLQALGALIPLGVAGFFFLRERRALLALMAGGGLAVRDLFSYSPGWNIVKFSMVSQIALAILSAAAIHAAMASSRWRPAGVVGLLAATFFGFAWPLSLASTKAGSDCSATQLAPADAEVIDFLRGRVKAGEGVLRTEHAELYAMFGGLPQPAWDWGTRSFGFSEALYERRRRVLAHPEDLREDAQQGFRWLVLGPSDAAVQQAAVPWIAAGDAELAASFPPLTVVHLK